MLNEPQFMMELTGDDLRAHTLGGRRVVGQSMADQVIAGLQLLGALHGSAGVGYDRTEEELFCAPLFALLSLLEANVGSNDGRGGKVSATTHQLAKELRATGITEQCWSI
jgi:hypothetical protein